LNHAAIKFLCCHDAPLPSFFVMALVLVDRERATISQLQRIESVIFIALF
jgi:hypothetical protein